MDKFNKMQVNNKANSRNAPVLTEQQITEVKKQQIIRILDEGDDLDEVTFQMEYKNKLCRVITKETLSAMETTHIEKLCRQYSNQDILIKVRNGKKLLIERTRIIRL